jgi:hypothetical protein
MTTDAASVVIVVLFALFAGVVAFIIRPRNRRQSRRPQCGDGLTGTAFHRTPWSLEIQPDKRFALAAHPVISSVARWPIK